MKKKTQKTFLIFVTTKVLVKETKLNHHTYAAELPGTVAC